MRRWPALIATVTLAVSLAGCVGRAPTWRAADAATVFSPSFWSEATFDVLTDTNFPPRHGNFTRTAAAQTSNSNFEVAYQDNDANAGILYHLIKPDDVGSTVPIPRGRNGALVDTVLRLRKQAAEAAAASGTYPVLEFIELDATFELATKTTPLEAKWVIFTHTTREDENAVRTGHWLVTGYQGMILLMQITYRDHILQRSQDTEAEPPSLSTLLAIHKALAREMLEPTRTFLQ
ncbi:MAG: hypothetical protein HQ481_10345 [Alphaproteobacteria bacterium]|nr:hypothetical protein [Alphaproteobacteria bacterium]